jgi:hypothetical protein
MVLPDGISAGTLEPWSVDSAVLLNFGLHFCYPFQALTIEV